MVSAYLLVIHGSRDSRPQIALSQLAELVQQKLATKPIFTGLNHHLVTTACLETTAIPLHENIQYIGKQALSLGYKELKIIPLFLLDGFHVKEDIPREVHIAQNYLQETIKLNLYPYLGSYSFISNLIRQSFSTLNTEGKILLAHGSRREKAHDQCELLAVQLEALVAYWSVNPSLNEQVEKLVNQGKKSISIVPYFLFNGGITDAIAFQIKELQSKFENTKLILGQTLANSPALVELIVEEITR